METKSPSEEKVKQILDGTYTPLAPIPNSRDYVAIFIPGKTRIYRHSIPLRRDWAFDLTGPHSAYAGKSPRTGKRTLFVNTFEERK